MQSQLTHSGVARAPSIDTEPRTDLPCAPHHATTVAYGGRPKIAPGNRLYDNTRTLRVVKRPDTHPEKDIAEFFPRGVPLRLHNRQTIFCEGDSAEYCYLVRSGVVRTYKLLEDGRRQIMGFYFPGDIFGLTLGDVDVYGYSADAINEVEAGVYANSTLELSACYDAELSRRLLEIRDRDLSAAKLQILLLGRMQARERVAAFLMDLWQRSQRLNGGTRDIGVPMTQADIADYVGLTVETVNRIISQFREQGTISVPARGTVRLERLDQLQDLAAA